MYKIRLAFLLEKYASYFECACECAWIRVYEIP